ncbi:MAG: pyridoxal phosphate-dependent aminotransferase [Acidobacteriota bacterium]
MAPMLSSRSDFDLEPHPLAAAAHRLRQAGKPVWDLTNTNPTRVGLAYPAAAIREAPSRADPLRYDPHPAGLEPARAAVAEIYRHRSTPADPEDLILAPGTSDAYAWLFKLLADPGDCVLVPRPSYPLFSYLARLESVRTVSYPLHWVQEWSVDLEEVRSLAAHHRPRAILLVHPNNPTGSYVKAFEWRFLEEIADRQGCALVCDEVFYDFPLEAGSRFDPAGRNDVPAFILNGISKMLSLPQLKLAWILLRGPSRFREAVRHRLELIADTFLSVNSVTQNALPDLLRLRSDLVAMTRSRCLENLQQLRSLTAGSPVQPLPVEGGWSAVLRIPATSPDVEVAQRLLETAGVLVHPGEFFEFAEAGRLVISLLPAPDEFRTGLQRLLQCISST